MKRIWLLSLLSTFSLTILAQTDYHIWEDQHVLSQHREAPRADFVPFHAKKGDRELSLDGMWKFNWTKTPDEQPVDFFKPSFDDSAWKEFPVPGDWEVNWMLLDKKSDSKYVKANDLKQKTAYGTPIYSSSGYTFKINPPYVMGKPKETFTAFEERNPTGCYRKWVEIPSEWQGKTIHLRIGSAASAVEVYVNGKYVGYSQGAMEPAEFVISPTSSNPSTGGESLKGEGVKKVLVALKVYKYCDGSYLEDQDQWRLGGLHRSVSMYATEPLRIRDLGVRTSTARKSSPYNDTDWILSVNPELEIEPSLVGKESGFALTANLYDAAGKQMNEKEMTAPVDTMLNLGAKGAILNARTPQRGYSKWGWMECKVENPKLWSAETPCLYTLRLCLKNKETGEVVEQLEQKVGFRDVKIADGQLLVNGKAVRLRGVNRHEFSATMGKVMTEESMLRDIKLMKQGNVNAVRTCHYPNTERWYELCDSIGLYVMDEMDIEEHGLRGKLAQDPSWTAAWLDRTQRCVIRDRNHPSVIMWSLGNESGYGPNFATCSQWIRDFDPTRPIHYEGAQGENGNDPQTVDVISRFYPRTKDEYLNPGVKDNNMERPENARWERLLQLAETSDSDRPAAERRPVLTSEYAHAMGNALGNFKEYWDEIYSNPRMLGGFIWEWADGEIKVLREDGKVMKAYGGDFDDAPNLKAFCVKGVVTSDREETSKYLEMKKVYSPLVITRNGKKDFSLSSRDNHLNLSDYVLSVEEKDGYTNVYAKLAVDKSWAKKGHVVTWQQFTSSDTSTEGKSAKANVPKMKTRMSSKPISSEQLKVFMEGVKPHLMRAATDNDKGFGNWIAKDWTKNGMDNLRDSVITPLKIETLSDGNSIATQTVGYCALEGCVIIDYVAKTTKDDAIELKATYRQEGTLPPLPCLGITLTVKALSQPSPSGEGEPSGRTFPRSGEVKGTVTWHGLGPMDTYPDRTSAAMMGTWTQPLSKQYTHEARPQDSGNHGEAYWMTVNGLSGKSGKSGNTTIAVETLGKPFIFSALPYSVKQLSTVKHDCDLVEEDHIYINIDCAQMGVGNSSCGPGVLTKYAIDMTKEHELHVKIKIIQ